MFHAITMAGGAIAAPADVLSAWIGEPLGLAARLDLWLSSAPGTRRGQEVSTAGVRSARSTSTVIDSVTPPR